KGPAQHGPCMSPFVVDLTFLYVYHPANSRAVHESVETVRVHGSRVTVVQKRTKCGRIKAAPAARGPEATPERASVSSDRSKLGSSDFGVVGPKHLRAIMVLSTREDCQRLVSPRTYRGTRTIVGWEAPHAPLDP